MHSSLRVVSVKPDACPPASLEDKARALFVPKMRPPVQVLQGLLHELGYTVLGLVPGKEDVVHGVARRGSNRLPALSSLN